MNSDAPCPPGTQLSAPESIRATGTASTQDPIQGAAAAGTPFRGRLLQRRPVRRQWRRQGRVLGLMLSMAVVGSAVLAIPSATAAPRPTIKEVQHRVDVLQKQADAATEDYDQTREQLKSVNVRLQASQAQLARQRVQVQRSRDELGQLAAETYRRGPLSTLDLVLGDDSEGQLAQAGYLPSLGNRQVAATNQLKLGEQNLVKTQAQIKAQQTKIQLANTKLRHTRDAITKNLSEATAEVHKLKASQQAALRRAQLKQEDVGLSTGGGSTSGTGGGGSTGGGGGSTGGGGGSTGGGSGGGGSADCGGTAVQAPSNAARTAIKYACAHLGDAYVWAADGPTTFDCSGLTMRAYQAAGIALPHSSQMQATYGTRVSVNSLEPGDLIFFESPISHVAIYLGNGMMIHAPHTGDVVRVASVYQTPSAAVRL